MKALYAIERWLGMAAYYCQKAQLRVGAWRRYWATRAAIRSVSR